MEVSSPTRIAAWFNVMTYNLQEAVCRAASESRVAVSSAPIHHLTIAVLLLRLL
jgi:hypothetical protein